MVTKIFSVNDELFESKKLLLPFFVHFCFYDRFKQNEFV